MNETAVMIGVEKIEKRQQPEGRPNSSLSLSPFSTAAGEGNEPNRLISNSLILQ